MSFLSSCLILSILRVLPHCQLLAGFLLPSLAAPSVSNGSQILPSLAMDRFSVTETPSAQLNLDRPQGQHKCLLFVVLRDRSQFPIENIQISVSAPGAEATRSAKEGWAAFELGRTGGSFQGNITVTMSAPSFLLSPEELEGATIDLAMVLNERSQDSVEQPILNDNERVHRLSIPQVVHGWRINVDRPSNWTVSASSDPLPMFLGKKLDLLDHSGGISVYHADEYALTARLGPLAANLLRSDVAAGQIKISPSSTLCPSVTRCRQQLKQVLFLPQDHEQRSECSALLFNAKSIASQFLPPQRRAPDKNVITGYWGTSLFR